MTAPHGTWPSPLTPDLIVQGSRAISELQVDGEDVCWLELRPDDAGRTAIVRRTSDGTTTDVTPAGANVRTRVHEYGGGSYLVHGGTTWYVEFDDQRLHRLDAGSTEPRPITPEPPQPAAHRYADLTLTPDGRHLVAVRERHEGDAATDVVNELVAIPVDGDGDGITVLAQGRDFYASPAVSPDGHELAYVAWDHPNMPWDATDVIVATLQGTDVIAERTVTGPSRSASEASAGTGPEIPSRSASEASAGTGPEIPSRSASEASAGTGRDDVGEAAMAPRWDPSGGLHLITDRATDGRPGRWWNLHRVEGDGTLVNLLPIEAELGQPGWQLGQSLYGFLDDGRIAVIAVDGAVETPSLLDPPAGTLSSLSDHTVCRDLVVAGDAVYVIAASPTAFPHVARILPTRGTDAEVEVLHVTRELPVDGAWLPTPEPVTFPTEDGAVAHGFLYPPTNPDVDTTAEAAGTPARPPLIVTSHGGPTASNPPLLSLGIAYWTSRGFAVVDVNYRGSTGFGRAYRDALRDRWGIADVEDCAAAARFLADRGDVDGDRLLIRGGSASGYTTLCALAFTDAFTAGASHYGVADPALLAQETHKFESRYLDGLLGAYPEARATYEARSPLHHAEGITCPVILFQGLDDRVVPPSQAEAMVAALAERGVPHAYLAFAGEGHGFRSAATITTALEAELSFYAQVLGIPHPEGIPEVEVTGLAT
jgi:dipeptidyl aminopeptidase/acylaminoacyl peptidase